MSIIIVRLLQFPFVLDIRYIEYTIYFAYITYLIVNTMYMEVSVHSTRIDTLVDMYVRVQNLSTLH